MRALRVEGGTLAARIGDEVVHAAELRRWRDTPAPEPRPIHHSEAPAAVDQLEVLLVEDNPADAALARFHLEGADVLVAETLAEAIDIMSRDGRRCVVLDLGLPDAVGLDGIGRLRQVAPTAPIIVLTGRDDEATGLAAIDAGAQDYLRKADVDRDRLLRSIRFARQRAELWSVRERSMLEDALTRLPGRQLIVDRLRHALASLDRAGAAPVACFFMDLDGFKVVNDTYGHAAGDHVLTAVGDRLRRTIRPSDSAGRYGGDEFLVVCPGVGGGPELCAIAERIASAIATPIPDGTLLYQVRASIGVAVADRPGVLASQLIERADAAMYDAKLSAKFPS
jgi:diguanylate cyclase (GGDEF)-like protein